jgi:hypothetical protein
MAIWSRGVVFLAFCCGFRFGEPKDSLITMVRLMVRLVR